MRAMADLKNASKIPTYFLLLMLLTIVSISFSGCLSNPSNSQEEESVNTQLSENEYYLEDVLSQDISGLYLKPDGSDVVTRLDADEFNAINSADAAELIFIGDADLDEAGACEVEDYGYFDPQEISRLTVLDELDDQSFETEQQANEILESAGFYYRDCGETGYVASKTKDKIITWGQYQGTQFVEGMFGCTQPYFEERDYGGGSNAPYYYRNGYSCPFVKTKNGYFIVDLSSLKPGQYILKTWSDGDCKFPINYDI